MKIIHWNFRIITVLQKSSRLQFFELNSCINCKSLRIEIYFVPMNLLFQMVNQIYPMLFQYDAYHLYEMQIV